MIEINKYIDSNILERYIGKIEKCEKIGGMTNLNIKVFSELGIFVVRICKEDTSEMINRKDEIINCKLVSEYGIDKSFLFMDENLGTKITKFIDKGENLSPKTALKEETMIKVVQALKKLHNSNVKFNNIFNPYEMICKYEKILIRNKGYFFEDYYEIREQIFSFEEKLRKYQIKLVACHNDTVPENFVVNKEELNMIDWEYSGMNDLVWDLAAHSLECGFTYEDEIRFLEVYYGNKCEESIKWRMKLYKVLQDFLWSLWSNIKISYGEGLEEYSNKRYDRCKRIIQYL
ncbi:choline kinase [Clostridiaceae bacterium 14S0207]|nr:choline kinase [Clostridiaceae bacterium 14S0207]